MAYILSRVTLFSFCWNTELRHGAVVSVVSSGSEEREFESHSGSDEVTLFPSSVYHNYGDIYGGGSYQSIGLTA